MVNGLVSGGAYYLDYVVGVGYACGIQLQPPPLVVFPGASGPLYCWGSLPNAGFGSNIVTTPTAVAPGVKFQSLRGGAGEEFLCAITSDGTTQCFGRNDMGQLGSVGAPSFSSDPVVVTGD
jgi:hypothetical protein